MLCVRFACRASVALAIVVTPAFARADPEPAPSSSSDVESARTHYSRGVKLYDQGAYAPALSELQRADELAPTYKLAYNIALVQMRLGDIVGALRSLRRYMNDGGAEVPPARRAEVSAYLADLPRRIASADVVANVVDADVSLDDHPLGKTPLSGSIELNPGPHRITASKAGLVSETKEIEVLAGEHAAVTLTLVEPPSAPLPPPEAPSGEVGRATSSPAASPAEAPTLPSAPPLVPPLSPPVHAPRLWIGWSVTGALAAGAVAFGAAALVESHVVSQDVDDRPTSGQAIRSAHQTTTALALVSDALTASALLAGATTAYFLLSTNRNAGSQRVEVRAGLGGVTLFGRF